MKRLLKFAAVFVVMFLIFSVTSIIGTVLAMLLGKWSWILGMVLLSAVASYFAWEISKGSWKD